MMDKIRRYMNVDIQVTGSEMSAKEAAFIMRSNSISALLVVDNNEYIGLLTHRDMSDKLVAEGLDPNEVKVTSLMETPLVTLDASLPMNEALLTMKKNRIRHVIATVDGKVAGILSITDFAHYVSLNISDPVSSFWSNSEALLDESTSSFAVEKLLKGMAEQLGGESKTTEAIKNKEEMVVIMKHATAEGLHDFADILKIFT
ncbi:MAG: CBS domain-containing protein [Nitrospinaceae bacterium]|nr:CBS domain-containing protein [Nitrospina sp.]MBT5377349.1 CBS domain-containing protein [Nitrospinaceae bacterium]MBT5867340.1 CBS domain-containing protein [Nitrospinaceae bacterium]